MSLSIGSKNYFIGGFIMEKNNESKSTMQVHEEKDTLEIPFSVACGNFEHFFKKQINEEFVAKVLQNVFRFHSVRRGQDGIEPDLIFDEKHAFEITLICDKKKHNNLIQRIQKGMNGGGFHSDDIVGEILSMIETCVYNKSKKEYANKETNLCLICPFPMMSWIADMDVIELIFVTQKVVCFDGLIKRYIETKLFKCIYVLVPNINGTWWVLDITGKKYQYIPDNTIKNYPFFMLVDKTKVI